MKKYNNKISEPLLRILQEKEPRATDILFFADECKIWPPKGGVEYVVGLGYVPIEYFLSNEPDGLLFQNTVVEKVESKNHMSMMKGLAKLISRSYMEQSKKSVNEDPKIAAYVVCNMFNNTKILYSLLDEMGNNKDSLPPIINVVGKTFWTKKGRVRIPRDYDYKQQVGEYSPKKFNGE